MHFHFSWSERKAEETCSRLRHNRGTHQMCHLPFDRRGTHQGQPLCGRHPRLAMKLFPVVWSSLLFLWVSESEANNPYICQEDQMITILDCLYPPSACAYDIEENVNFNCTLSPTNILNCSWSFHTLDKHVSIFISVCDGNWTIQPMSLISEESVGSTSMALQEYDMLQVILYFNVSQNNEVAIYRYVYDTETMEIPSPPENITASFKNGGLLVTWELPKSHTMINSWCFRYQLDVGHQEERKELSDKLFLLRNADPAIEYQVRVRAAIDVNSCPGPNQWSGWSQTVTVHKHPHRLNIPLIISISLGIPMILLALLLFVRHQRIFEVLFPPIPHPPLKYKHFLEKNDTFNFHYPAAPVKAEEEITEVQDADQGPEKEN